MIRHYRLQVTRWRKQAWGLFAVASCTATANMSQQVLVAFSITYPLVWQLKRVVSSIHAPTDPDKKLGVHIPMWTMQLKKWGSTDLLDPMAPWPLLENQHSSLLMCVWTSVMETTGQNSSDNLLSQPSSMFTCCVLERAPQVQHVH